jgi:hypothetical protein
LIVPPKPITNAITSSVAVATRPGAPSTYIMPGTPTKPPTAMIEASNPVANPKGSVKSTDTRTFAVLKCIMVPGISTDWTQRASRETLSCSSDLPER